MTDEKFVFVSEVKDKKRTARSANNKIRGAGHRSVKMPSDYLTEKERKALNGEVKSYNLKQPMTWAAYKALPDDIRREYITRLHRLYRASNNSLAGMFGVTATTVFRELERLGIESLGKGNRVLPEWQNFVKYGTPETTKVAELIPEPIREKLQRYEEEHPPAVIAPSGETSENVIPDVGDIRIKGNVKTVGKTLELLLGDRKMSFRISWEVAE